MQAVVTLSWGRSTARLYTTLGAVSTFSVIASVSSLANAVMKMGEPFDWTKLKVTVHPGHTEVQQVYIDYISEQVVIVNIWTVGKYPRIETVSGCGVVINASTGQYRSTPGWERRVELALPEGWEIAFTDCDRHTVSLVIMPQELRHSPRETVCLWTQEDK